MLQSVDILYPFLFGGGQFSHAAATVPPVALLCRVVRRNASGHEEQANFYLLLDVVISSFKASHNIFSTTAAVTLAPRAVLKVNDMVSMIVCRLVCSFFAQMNYAPVKNIERLFYRSVTRHSTARASWTRKLWGSTMASSTRAWSCCYWRGTSG